jgi:peptide deformylase
VSKLKIFTFPEKVLAQKAKPIDRVDKSWHKVADDMLETMYEAPGIGLAANQVGRLDRIIVVDTDYRLKDDEADRKSHLDSFPEALEVEPSEVIHKNPIILINPEIILKEGKIKYCEGCLSVPEYSAEVERAAKIKVKYKTIDGLEKVLDAEGLMAVCLQHEIDHLDGKLFLDRIANLKTDIFRRKVS